MDQEGWIVAYAKVATTPQAKQLIENEATALRRLEQLKLQTADIPRLMYFGEIEQDTILVQEAEYPLKPGPIHLSNQHISFLAEIFNKTTKKWMFEESPLFSSFRGHALALNSPDCDGWHQLLQSTSEKVRQRFSGQEIQLGLAYKDFAPWNTCLNKEGQVAKPDEQSRKSIKTYIIKWLRKLLFIVHQDLAVRILG